MMADRLQARDAALTCIVDQHIQPAICLDGLLDQQGGDLGGRDISSQPQGLAS